MKNRLYRIGLTFLLVAASLSACREYEFMIPEDGEGITTEDPEITAAREWYELNKFQVLEARSGGQHPLFAAMEPNWVETYTREDDGYKTVESALLMIQSRRRILPECNWKYEQTGDVNYLQSMTRLVIRTDLQNGETVGFFMVILPSVRYLETTKFKPFYRMTYIDRDEQFDGEILYYELDGRFANGWCYLDGEIIYAIRQPLEGEPLTRGGQYVCHDVYEITCTDYHTVTEFEDQLDDRITGSSCTKRFLERLCEYVPGNSGGGSGGSSGGGSGSGGGYATTPTVDGIMMPNTSLTLAQKAKLEGALNEFISAFPEQAKMYLFLKNGGFKICFRVSTSAISMAQYDLTDHSITFRSTDDVIYDNLREEMFHAIQHCDVYRERMPSLRKDIEFEVKVFMDLLTERSGNGMQLGSMGQTPEFQDEYSEWIGKVIQGKDTVLDRFYYFCNQYTVYPGKASGSFSAEFIYKYFNK